MLNKFVRMLGITPRADFGRA